MKLSIIIPVYNEEKTIAEIISRVKRVNLGKDIKKEIIIVDDGSTDNSVKIASSLIDNKSAIKLIKHRKNQGKGAAIETG